MALLSPLIGLGFDVFGKALYEHEGSHLARGRGKVAFFVDEPIQRRQRTRAFGFHFSNTSNRAK